MHIYLKKRKRYIEIFSFISQQDIFLMYLLVYISLQVSNFCSNPSYFIHSVSDVQEHHMLEYFIHCIDKNLHCHFFMMQSAF